MIRAMDTPQPTARALVLLSGGLDSELAAHILRDQGLTVCGITFESPFFGSERARMSAERMQIPIHVLDFTKDIMAILNKPKHGFGSGMNPCIDCHAAMLKRAGDKMKESGFDFLATGEVLNQRPMSQTRHNLEVVATESGYADFIVRPLSAALLPETGPERRKQVDRQRLLAIDGRSRKIQLELARHYGITGFSSGTGGCRLTEPHFSARLRDLKAHEGLCGLGSIALLRVGRHFRLNPLLKLIVGRNESDNNVIEESAELGDLVLKTDPVPGPTCILPATASDSEVRLAAAICARYCDSSPDAPIAVSIRSAQGLQKIAVAAASPEAVERMRIGGPA
jgi:tRNA-uridine 2-sulfurtransferase